MSIDPVIAFACCVLLAAVLGQAGLHKLRAHAVSAAIIDDYRLLPAGGGRIAAPLLAVLELCAAAAILLPATREAGLLLAALLLAAYFAAIAINLARGRHSIACGCGGSGDAEGLSGALLVRNAVLIALALGVALGEPVVRALGWLDWFAAPAAGLAATLLYLAVDRLIATHRLLGALR